MFLANTGKVATFIDYVVKITPREHAVMVFGVIFLNIEINTAVAFISKTVIENFPYQFFLLYNVSRGMRFDAGRKNIESLHGIMVTVRIILSHFHGFKLFKAGFLLYFILTFVSVVLQMPHIGNVPYISYLISYMLQIAKHHVESYSRTCMTKMGIAINCRTTNIHSNPSGSERLECLFHSSARIINQKSLSHIYHVFIYETSPRVPFANAAYSESKVTKIIL